MYERFTPRARWVMEQAAREAKRMEHDYVGTEHILLALLQERHGYAKRIFKQLEADLRKIGKETEKMAERGSHNLAIGKLRLTPHAKNVLQFAHEEAKARQLFHVGTSMVLLGLLREEDGIAAVVLTQNEVPLRGATSVVQALIKGHVDLAHEPDAPQGSPWVRLWAPERRWLVAAGMGLVALGLAAVVTKLLSWW